MKIKEFIILILEDAAIKRRQEQLIEELVLEVYKVTRKLTIEQCKEELLKHCQKVIYEINDYPIEAVPKSTILSLESLMREQKTDE